MNKILYICAWLLAILITLGAVNKGVADLTGDPIFKPFGTSTTFKDSTNYVTLNKGFRIRDSLVVGKDVYIRGNWYLDTNRQGQIYFIGNDIEIVNNKGNGAINLWIGEKNSALRIYKSRGGSGVGLMTLDTINGITLSEGDIQLSGGTQQIKIPSDTASDYDNNDNITLNRQSGTLTTKSLTTAAGNLYVLTLTNSLISSTSKIFASLNDGTSTQGLTILYQTRPSSGTGSIVIYNAHASQAFNGTLKIYYVIFN